MALILLYLGEEFTRFPNLTDAKKAGSKKHTQAAPAQIEVTLDEGGPMTTIKFDPQIQDWI